jgi:hypothetical protein
MQFEEIPKLRHGIGAVGGRDHDPAGHENAVNRCQRAINIRQMIEHVIRHHDIKGVIGKGQCLRVGLDKPVVYGVFG